jgi:hypothetical protein
MGDSLWLLNTDADFDGMVAPRTAFVPRLKLGRIQAAASEAGDAVPSCDMLGYRVFSGETLADVQANLPNDRPSGKYALRHRHPPAALRGP